MRKIIAIANQKGGVGKTTTVLNLAAGLVRKEKKVCVIDFDAQANLTDYLAHIEDDKPTIADLMTMIANGNGEVTKAVIRTNHEGIDYVPANITLASADYFLINSISRETVLKRILDTECFEKYDYIIIDCLPSLGILLINALTACDEVIIPVQTQKFAMTGLHSLFDVLKRVRTGLNPKLKVGGILLTMSDNTNMSKSVIEALTTAYPDWIFETSISRSVMASTSSYLQKSLNETEKIGKQYTEFVEEIISKERQSE